MATKSKIAQAAAATAKVEAPVVEEPQMSTFEYMRNMASQLGIVVPTGRQMLAGSVVSFLVGFMGGYAASTIAGYVFIGAVLLTGSMFLAYLSMFITLVIGIYASCIAASRAGSYVANGHLERDAKAVKNWVTGFISSSKAKLSVAVQS